MCGIAGIVDSSGVDPLVLDAMRDRMVHRGPDDAGSVIVGAAGLASRRLAIIDISSDGHQPMAYGPFTLTYNGELYNYLELRDELTQLGHRFVTKSDTEVLLHAYAEWGAGCLGRLNGMFAFAVWDERSGELFAARDRFGERPFFYVGVGSAFVFASELKALFAFPNLPRRPNDAAVFRFLAYGQLTAPAESFFADIHRLPAGHALRWRDGEITVSRYYALGGEELAIPFDEATHQLRELLRDSVRLRLRSDVAVGSSLSGGIDSSAIVAMVAQEHGSQRRTTFSARFDGFALDEGTYIDEVVARAGAEGFAVYPTDHELSDDLDQLVLCQEEPFGSTSIYAQWRVMKLARAAGIKVLLDGQGADELFAGYPAYSTTFLMTMARHRPGRFPIEAARWRSTHGLRPSRLMGGLWMGGYPAVAAPLVERLSEALHRQDLGVIDPRFRAAHANMWHPRRYPRRDPLRSALLNSLDASILPGLLRYADRNSLAHSVEVRLPFLDHRLAEFAFRLPAAYKIHEGTTKWVLREAVRDLVPARVLDRKDKVGFVAPQTDWMRGGLHERISEVVGSRALRERGLVDGVALDRLWREHQAGAPDHSAVLWRAVILELWCATFIDGTPPIMATPHLQTAAAR